MNKNQLLSLRPYFNKKKNKEELTDSKHLYTAPSVREIFLDPAAAAALIPPGEEYNFFYTVARCSEKKRSFTSQDVMMFDIDGMQITEDKDAYGGFKECDGYISAVCGSLGLKLDRSTPGVVFSGNGLHFAICLETPIVDEIYFDKNRRHYTAVCEKINTALARANLPGKADPAVFDPRRIMRLPNTENRKPNKPPRWARVIQVCGDAITFDIAQASGLPDVSASDQLNSRAAKKIPTDKTTVLEGCDFIKWMKADPNAVNESQWYAGLSILGRLGRDIAQEYSKGHKGYSVSETESKIDQALDASGPRTCKGIQKLWGQCQKCPNFEKVESPIMLRGAGFIKTSDTGFHNMVMNKHTGDMVPKSPNYEDLRRFFEQEAPYKVLGSSGIVFRYNGTFWKETTDLELQNYAQMHFDPVANTSMTSEFKNLVCRTNLESPDWFGNTTQRKLNFSNGILDLADGSMSMHSPNFGFTYCLPYAYDPTAKAPIFENFIREVMDNRDDLVNLVLQFVGYCFSGDACWAQKALLLTGEGANGKSTFMDVLKALAGKANYSSVTLGDLQDPVHRYSLVGKLFNLAEETPSYAMTESSHFKNLVTGGEVSVKQLYKQPARLNNMAKLMFACNDLPATKDVSKGLLRRLLIVPFDRTFEGDKDDKSIGKQMLAELPGIFNLVIKHYHALARAKQFTKTIVVDEQVEKFHLEIDNVKRWFVDSVEVKPVTKENADLLMVAKVGLLYGAYRIYADNEGERPVTKVAFAKRLVRLIPDAQIRRRKGTTRGDREIGYIGLQVHESSRT